MEQTDSARHGGNRGVTIKRSCASQFVSWSSRETRRERRHLGSRQENAGSAGIVPGSFWFSELLSKPANTLCASHPLLFFHHNQSPAVVLLFKCFHIQTKNNQKTWHIGGERLSENRLFLCFLIIINMKLLLACIQNPQRNITAEVFTEEWRAVSSKS